MSKIYFTALLAGFATLAQAVKLTNSDYDVVPGQSFTIKWADAEGAVSIRLKSGPANNLNTVEEITNGQSGGSYTWSVPANLETTQYAIEIEDDAGNVNYSVQFPVSGTDGSQTTASSAESAPTTSVEPVPTTTPESTPTTKVESVPTTGPESAQTTHAEESSIASTTTQVDRVKTTSKATESASIPDNNSASGRGANVFAGLVAGVALLVAY